MNFKPKIQSNYSWLKLLLLTLAIMFSITFFNSLEVHASYVTMTENDSAGKGTGGYEGGVSYYQTGWVFYLLDLEGKGVGSPHAVTSYAPIATTAGDSLPSNNVMIKPRRGHKSTSPYVTVGAPWGPPFDIDANLRGDEVREWLLTTDPNGHTRAANLIKDTPGWGTGYAKQWENKELVLVFEPFMWYHMHILNSRGESVKSGKWICATSHWLGLVQMGPESTGHMTKYGTNAYSRYTNQNLPNSMVLHPDPILKNLRLGPAPHGGKVTNTEMATIWPGTNNLPGWGIGLVYNDVPAINTYDRAQGSPGPAENPVPDKVGTTTIVKGYYTEDEETGEKKDGKVYTQPNTTNKINIMEEPEYQLVRWDITTSEPTEPDPTGSWVTGSKSGTSPTTVELKENEKTLYVLLKKVEAAPPEVGNELWVLNESEITAQVSTANKEASNGTDLKLTVTLPNLTSRNILFRNQVKAYPAPVVNALFFLQIFSPNQSKHKPPINCFYFSI